MTPTKTGQETEGIRLSKRVADILKCSRSEAEQVIVGGWVKVNEVVVDEPAHRVSHENIEIHSTTAVPSSASTAVNTARDLLLGRGVV